MTSLHDPQVRDFLSGGTKVGKLGYSAKDGRPLVVPIWFLVQGDALVFHTSLESAKGKALRRDPRVALTVDVETPPYAYVQVQGTAELDSDPSRETGVFREIAGRYLPPEAAEAFVAEYSGPGGALFVVRPTKVVTFGNLAAE